MENENKKKTKTIIGIIVGIIVLVVLVLLLTRGCEAKEHKITFDTDGGNTVESIRVKENGQIERPSDPTKEGYEFVGWYYNGKPFDFSTKITRNMKLEARWEKALEEISIEGFTLEIGESKTITVKTKPSGKTVELVWSSSDSSIASVNQNGKVTAKKAGKVTITVKTKDGKHKTSCEVTVNEEKKEETTEDNSSSSNNSTPSKKNPTTTQPSNPQPSTPQPSNPQPPVQDRYSIVMIRLKTQLGSNLQNQFGTVTKNGATFTDYTDIVINGNYFSAGEVVDSSVVPSTVTLMKNGTVIGTASVTWTEQTVQ